MKKLIIRRKLLLMLFLPGGMLVFWITSIAPALAEAYSNYIFKPISIVMSTITGILPFSLAELLIVSGIILIIYLGIRAFKKAEKSFVGRRNAVVNYSVNLLITASIAYFAYVILWGINFNRTEFSKIAGLNVSPATQTELTQLCVNLIARANATRANVKENKDGVMELSTSINDTIKRANIGYENIVKDYPQLKGNYGKAKKVFFSGAMNYTGVVGMYFPFTFEANINTQNTAMDIPESICHEMAHQRGFSREDDANFISFLTCINHPDADFQYSGTFTALIYSMNKLFEYNPDKYNELSNTYSDAVARDFEETRKHWEAYQGPVTEISQAVNDTYLKANKQEEGIRSYGAMVDLLIGWQRQH